MPFPPLPFLNCKEIVMHELVKDYYGRRLQSTADLRTTACCDASQVPEWLKPVLARIHPEVMSRYYGCGLVCPPLLQDCHVLDLGCGSGRDVYALAQLVGETGRVVGVDMTDEQLSVAEQHREHHRLTFGFTRDNVEFRRGYIEQLDQLGLEDASFDVVVSNCVVNLSSDKNAVLRHVHRLLKTGGEFYFSDVYADRRVPTALRNDPVLYGECLSGALYWNDFLHLAQCQGFADPRLVEDRPIAITDPLLAERTAGIGFFSATCRLFKLEKLEPECEDYGQAVIYRGGIQGHEQHLAFDKHHVIEAGRVFAVCGNTWRMLHDSRFRPHFEFIGDFNRHYGPFAGCGGGLPFDTASPAGASGCC